MPLVTTKIRGISQLTRGCLRLCRDGALNGLKSEIADVRKAPPIGDISMLFNRLASLRDQDRREMIYAKKNLPRNLPASCLREIADDLRQRMRQNKNASPSRRSYCRRSGRLSGPRKPNPCQRTLAGSGKVMLGKRSNSMGSRMSPTVRRDRCTPAQ